MLQKFYFNDEILTIDFRENQLPFVIKTEKVQKPTLVLVEKTIEKRPLIYKGPIEKGGDLNGLQITKIILGKQEFTPKANRFLLKIVLNYLVKELKINLFFDLPYKASEKSTRCLINNCKFHPDKKKMSDILPLIDGNEDYFIDTKGSNNSLHNLCYELLKRHNLPLDILEIHYSSRVKKIKTA